MNKNSPRNGNNLVDNLKQRLQEAEKMDRLLRNTAGDDALKTLVEENRSLIEQARRLIVSRNKRP